MYWNSINRSRRLVMHTWWYLVCQWEMVIIMLEKLHGPQSLCLTMCINLKFGIVRTNNSSFALVSIQVSDMGNRRKTLRRAWKWNYLTFQHCFQYFSTIRSLRGRCCGFENAAILFIRRHCEYGIAYGIEWWTAEDPHKSKYKDDSR